MQQWKDIKGYEGMYQVSDMGNIRSLDRIVKRKNHTVKIKGKILSPNPLKKSGHMYVNLSKNGKYKSLYVHRLVALHFIGNPPTIKHQVSHINCEAQDNRVNNLEWATQSENNLNGVRNGKKLGGRGLRSGKSKFTYNDLKEIYFSDKSFRELGRKYKVSPGVISSIKKGKSYKEEIKKIKSL